MRKLISRLVGPRVWRALTNFFRTVRPRKPPAPRAIDYAPDVADAAALRAFLVDTDVFGFDVAMGERYVDEAIERFRITMSLLPNLGPGTRVLELGANPYFLTRLLLRRGTQVTCANFFDETYDRRGRQTVRSGTEVLELDFDHFNVERDAFPYPDESFDVVLCCEILEHLPNDPTHMLCEIHRVLREDGVLILTTPNPVRWRLLLEMIEGRNTYEHLSAFGTYGRHNREYTLAELRDLLVACGYEVDDAFAANLEPPPPWIGDLPPGVSLHDREDNLFAVARAVGVPNRAYPEWLYSGPGRS